jgi:hypothetical protein
MNEKEELARSIIQANSLKKITKMAGWKIIKRYLNETTVECQETLENEENKDMADIQASRKLLKWIQGFKELFEDTEFTAEEAQRELKLISKFKKGE